MGFFDFVKNNTEEKYQDSIIDEKWNLKLKKILLNASEEVNNLQKLLIIANEETIKLNQQLNEAIRFLYQSEEEPKNILS